MRVSGTTFISLKDFHLTDLRGIEARCAETGQPFLPGEKVIVFAEGTFSEDADSVHVDPAIRLIKIQTAAKDGSPLEDFIARYLNNSPTPPVASAAVVPASSEQPE